MQYQYTTTSQTHCQGFGLKKNKKQKKKLFCIYKKCIYN